MPRVSTRHRVRLAAFLLAALLAACARLPVVDPPPAQVGGRLVVFDVDGTLTPTVARIFSVRPAAAAVAKRYAGRGYRILYLTARTPALQGTLRGFLARRGFPEGDLVAPDRAGHAAPAAFKARVLQGYRARGWEIAAAFGDSSTDFEAYARAGVPRERVFALQRVGAPACQPGAWAECLRGWEPLLEELSAAPAP